MAATTKYFEDFQVGDTFHIPAKTMTDAHFLFFAGLTGDHHPIHYDDEYAKTTRFGSFFESTRKCLFSREISSSVQNFSESSGKPTGRESQKRKLRNDYQWC